MKYRSDIDGLRAISVVAVLLFHSGVNLFSGGYVGVDVFFVISGYLITNLIFEEVKLGEFTFSSFYKRRAARLLPSLIVTFVFTFLFAFVFYDNAAFDNFGKELFFSSFGAANILFAQGVDYFHSELAYQPLIHLWSLGVEEQFYILWPVVLLVFFRYGMKFIWFLVISAFILSLGLSVNAVANSTIEGYFLLQYRAFELLIGVMVALACKQGLDRSHLSRFYGKLSFLGLLLIVVPMTLLNEKSSFPGLNALIPCLGAALIIFCKSDGWVNNLLSRKMFVFYGLISYPLYLFHQPLISAFKFFDTQLNDVELFASVFIISTFLAWIVYKLIETPIRRLSRDSNSNNGILALLIASIPTFALLGGYIAKSDGIPFRFDYLNPFASEVTLKHSSAFHKSYRQGFNVSEGLSGKILFVGDSVVQHYVPPFASALDLEIEDVDTVTRGGCVLLDGVNFLDKIASISCNNLRTQLYNSNKNYEYIVISQSWDSYDDFVTNFPEYYNGVYKWESFIHNSIDKLLNRSNKIIFIATHPRIKGTKHIQPSILLSHDIYQQSLKGLVIENEQAFKNERTFFETVDAIDNVEVIYPEDIFCDGECILYQDASFFSDSQHLTSESVSFVSSKIRLLL
ncbi:acyltransferase family protein [Shewanella baltica]|uniref:acyltransferase family protein n=1 Tax=Shewanella baltica TaxID=62322 RepID=UPI0024BAA60F|nr:acyltransferase family protein [Shewanella baltica]